MQSNEVRPLFTNGVLKMKHILVDSLKGKQVSVQENP